MVKVLAQAFWRLRNKTVELQVLPFLRRHNVDVVGLRQVRSRRARSLLLHSVARIVREDWVAKYEPRSIVWSLTLSGTPPHPPPCCDDPFDHAMHHWPDLRR